MHRNIAALRNRIGPDAVTRSAGGLRFPVSSNVAGAFVSNPATYFQKKPSDRGRPRAELLQLTRPRGQVQGQALDRRPVPIWRHIQRQAPFIEEMPDSLPPIASVHVSRQLYRRPHLDRLKLASCSRAPSLVRAGFLNTMRFTHAGTLPAASSRWPAWRAGARVAS
jgi:hypothetical protein